MVCIITISDIGTCCGFAQDLCFADCEILSRSIEWSITIILSNLEILGV